MKHKHTHYTYASFALLLFVALGYMVKFYPEALTGFDSNIQTWVRGGLPAGLTRFFKTITMLGNTPVQAIIAIVAVIWLYLRQYKSEAIFVGASGLLASILIVSLKYIYQRQRPSITHLVHASGYSFPSGHSLGTFMILGAIAIVLAQRLEKKESKIVVYAITAVSYTHLTLPDEEDSVDLGGRRIIKKYFSFLVALTMYNTLAFTKINIFNFY